MTPNDVVDVAIIGAGIVGLATAYGLARRHPSLNIVVLEKESDVAKHQTGHNSGVIHSGIYYKPGSFKARLCVEGVRKLEAFCDTHGVPYQRIGKVIVAVREDEIPHLNNLYERGVANGVPGVRKINAEELHEIEPHAAGLCAIHSPNTGIVDYKQVAHRMRDELQQRGVAVNTSSDVMAIRTSDKSNSPLRIRLKNGDEAHARYLINCAGLHSDVIARMMGLNPDVRIVPFRGEYYFVKPDRHNLVCGLIYPVPDPAFPFLGVHFTRTIHGEVEAGPNAVFAFAREGYSLRRINASDLARALAFPGFAKIARKWWRTGAFEMYRSLSKPVFVKSLQTLVPEITGDDIIRGGAGVRAQAVSVDGQLVDDFRFIETPQSLHVLNAPSPAATASLAIGEYIVERAQAIFATAAT
jgi:L-2-hydroxyglutarate oxidase LhgO